MLNRLIWLNSGWCCRANWLVLAMLLPAVGGCTVDRIKTDAGDALQALDFRSGISVSRRQGFRLSPTTPVYLQHRRHSDAAELDDALTGLSRVFYEVRPADPDALPEMGLLMVLEPPTAHLPAANGLRVRLLPVEHLLPRPAKTSLYRIHLLDLAANQVVDVIELKIDPAWFRRELDSSRLLERGFEQFAHALMTPSDA